MQLDERRIVVVAPRFDGYVEGVGLVTTGTHVMKGDVLARVFGQDVLNQRRGCLSSKVPARQRHPLDSSE